MRSVFVVAAVVVGACSSSDDTPSTPDAGGTDASTSSSSSSSSSSGGVIDASTTTDGAPVDAGSDASDCTLLGGNYDKTCAVAGDCLMVARGCYCGAQPIIGVNKSAQPAAQACETKNQNNCGLGCANFPGHVGDDGKNDEGTGKNIEVYCDNNQCKTRLQP